MNESAAKKHLVQVSWLLAAAMTLVILCLHFELWMRAGGFCGDEVDVINLSTGHSLSAMAHDSFPVLMPLLIKGWTAIGLGNADFQLRLLGVLLGVAIIGALWLAAWKIRNVPPLLSLALFGLNATAIFREDYLRAYGAGSLLILLVLFAMLCLLERPTWKRTIFLAAAAILSVQALFQNAVFVAAICISGWTICGRQKDGNAALKIFVGAAAAAISLLPYWNFIFEWTHSTTAIRPGFSSVAALDNFGRFAGFPLPQYVWVWTLFAAFVVAKGFIVLIRKSPPPVPSPRRLMANELQLFSGVALFTATIGYFLFLKFAALITSPWYFLPLLALAAICFDLSISPAVVPRAFQAVIWGLLLATAGISTIFAARDLNCRFTNADLIANRLAKEISPQDYVVVTPWYFGISFNRYYRGPAEWETLPPVADHSTYRFDLISAQKGDDSQKVFNRIASTLQSGHRVWVVGSMDAPRPGERAHSAAAQFIAGHSQSFKKIELKTSEAVSDYEDESLLMAEGWNGNGDLNLK